MYLHSLTLGIASFWRAEGEGEGATEGEKEGVISPGKGNEPEGIEERGSAPGILAEKGKGEEEGEGEGEGEGRACCKCTYFRRAWAGVILTGRDWGVGLALNS